MDNDAYELCIYGFYLAYLKRTKAKKDFIQSDLFINKNL